MGSGLLPSKAQGCVGWVAVGTEGLVDPMPQHPAAPQSLLTLSVTLQPTNFTNPVYATLYMGGHGSRHSLASTDEKRELLGRGPEDEIGDPLA